jgi:predicted neuraminidase
MKMHGVWPVAVMGCLLWGAALAPAAEAAPKGATNDVALCPPPVNLTPGPEYADGERMFQGIPGIERAKNGRLWATWYGGGVTEDEHNYIMLVTSGDDGATWSGLKLVIDPDGAGPCRAFDPCLWHDPQGRLWLSWAERHKSEQLWAISTADSGSENPTWSVPRLIHEGIMMNKPLFTSGGAWLLPVAKWHQEGSAMVVASADQGATFQLRGSANVLAPKDRNCDEHMLVERKDSSLWMLVRTSYGIGESVSTDQGKTWSAVERSALPHTVSRFFIRRLNSGKLLLVRHDGPGAKRGRSHLTAFLSNDDGKTWAGGLLLDERNGVSYPDGVQAPDGTIRIIYDFNRTKEKQILMARFTEEDVLQKRLVSPAGRLRMLVNQATGVNTAVKPPKAHTSPAARTDNADGDPLLAGPAAGIEVSADATSDTLN